MASQELKQTELELVEAYRNLDRHKRRLKTVKSLVFDDDKDDNTQREELGDVNWLRLKEMENKIKFVNIEIEQLRKQEQSLHKFKV